MKWQILISAQIIVSAGMTILTRKLALIDRKLFFVIGVLSYAMVALLGFIFSLIFGSGLPHVANNHAWLFLVLEGICIPAGWLFQYKIISKLGASNGVLLALLNNIAGAIMGFLLLADRLTAGFLVGASLIIGSILIAFRIQADNAHHERLSITRKIVLVAAMATLFAIGIFAEKRAIDMIGVWNYSSFGWGLQFCSALVICVIYGRGELSHIRWDSVRRGLTLGFVTSIAGGLFIYALSIGTLSHTIIASSGKIALTMIFAIIFLKERNAIAQRLSAFALATIGLWFLVR